MADLMCEDPEPSNPFPAGPLHVPVRSGPAGCTARLFRSPLGERTAVGFTSERRLRATLGPDQAWIRLAEPALRALTAPLGVTTVTIDPQFSAPAPARDTAAVPAPGAAAVTAPARESVAASAPGTLSAQESSCAPGTPAQRAVPGPEGHGHVPWDPQAVGALRVTGAAALVSALALWIG
ncbi:SAV_915 family protein [Streptomyces cadmiisoli]|uniref:SAV_915 family protein n=1 Tax=Streptomyces cadmiisoli TaxID=2184053 RepID=UPI003663D828